MAVKVFLVGGALRDELLGETKPKDFDYAVEASSFAEMREEIVRRGGVIYREEEPYFTIRANVPGLGATDYVLCRKDGRYLDGRRPSSVEIGTIYDDLKRRDFTSGAMARNVDTGEFLDPHNGRGDIQKNLLRCVGNTRERFAEDSLRLLRAMRFHITRGFELHQDIDICLATSESYGLLSNASVERVRDELYKCFSHDTLRTLSFLYDYSGLRNVLFHRMTARGLWLAPTLKEA